jgi:hypothetical protein
LVPTLLAFTLHWYTGDVPALVTTAVNEALLPEQIVLPPLMVTVDAPDPFTVIVTVFEFTTELTTQVAFEVIVHITTSLLFSPDETYERLLVPTPTPFTFHW